MRKISKSNETDVNQEIVRTSRLLSIPFASSTSLAASVVVYRALGIDKEMSVLCMKELARRRWDGSDFNYEDYIESKLKEMPQQNNMDLVKVSQDVHTGVTNSLNLNNVLKRKL